MVVFGSAICYALTVADRVSTRYLLQTPPTGLQQWAGYSTDQIVSPKQANDYNNVKFRLIVQYQASVIVQIAHQQNTQKRLIMFMHICSLYFYADAVYCKQTNQDITICLSQTQRVASDKLAGNRVVQPRRRYLRIFHRLKELCAHGRIAGQTANGISFHRRLIYYI